MEVAPLLIHIGFHKTASTWLQQDLFKDPSGRFTTDERERRQEIIMRIGVPDPLSYDAPSVAAYYAPAVEAAREAHRTLALSHEQLSGYPSSGGRDRCMIADRLRATFPEGRILIVFREQRSLIQSMYSQHIRGGGVESVRRYLTTPEPGCLRRPSFTLEFYEFDRLIEYYYGLYGRENVLALPVELLANRPTEFVDRITSFCGHPKLKLRPVIRRNVRRPELMQLFQRPLNMFFFHSDLSPGALIHIHRFNHRYEKYFGPVFDSLSPRFIESFLLQRQRKIVEEVVGNHYARSNRRTEEITKFQLKEFGYQVE